MILYKMEIHFHGRAARIPSADPFRPLAKIPLARVFKVAWLDPPSIRTDTSKHKILGNPEIRRLYGNILPRVDNARLAS